MAAARVPLGDRRERRSLRLRGRSAVRATIIVVLILGAWQVVLTLAPSEIMPAPLEILDTLATYQRSFTTHLLTTASEAVAGLFLALVVALPLAIVSITSRSIEDNVFRATIVLNSVPLIVLAPLLVIWMGTGLAPRIVVAAIACYFGILVSSVRGLKSMSGDRMELFHILGANAAQTFWLLRVPAALPHVLAALKVAVVASVFGAVIGEWVGANQGLGVVLYYALFQFQVAQLWTAMLLCTLLALSGFLVVGLLERVLISWHESMHSSTSAVDAPAVER